MGVVFFRGFRSWDLGVRESVSTDCADYTDKSKEEIIVNISSIEYERVMRAFPGDGSFMELEELAEKAQIDRVKVLQVLWNLDLSGLAWLDIAAVLTVEGRDKIHSNEVIK